jgi:hypothetical protein
MYGLTRAGAVSVATAVLVVVAAPAGAQTPHATGAEIRETRNGQRQLAEKHLHDAIATIGRVDVERQPADARTYLAELKWRLNALGGPAGDGQESADAATTPRRGADDRDTELAAIDRLFTTLLGTEQTTGAVTLPPQSTMEATGTLALDPATRGSLEQARTHLTAYAAAMGSAERITEAQADRVSRTAAPGASGPPSAADATADTSPTDPTPSPTGSSPTDMPQTAAVGDRADQATSGADSAYADPEARQHLLAARDTLSDLTQMPQAADITGEVRSEISRIISRFNELIAAGAEWREPLAEVTTRLDALLEPAPREPDGTDPRPVGTFGTAALDPAVRAKLEDFRTHLDAFERLAAGRMPEPADDAPAATTAMPPDVATRASETDPTAASGSVSTGSAAAGMPAPTADTVGGAARPPTDPTISEALRHIEAIEALIAGQDRVPGTAADGTGPVSVGAASDVPAMPPAHVEDIRRHLNELRRLLEDRPR